MNFQAMISGIQFELCNKILCLLEGVIAIVQTIFIAHFGKTLSCWQMLTGFQTITLAGQTSLNIITNVILSPN